MSEETLQSFFDANGKVAIALSGGTDSAFLLHRANAPGADVLPVIVRTRLSRETEVDRAIGLCASEGLEPVVVDINFLSIPDVSRNGADRCYHCKHAMFSAIRETASRLGYPVVADGTNASDPVDDRPGVRALRELGVRSPLRDADLSKSAIRRISRMDRLETWNKQSNSCLATRVQTGVRITPELIGRVAASEDALAAMGFSGMRVRTDGSSATVQFNRSQIADARERFDSIRDAVAPYFNDVRIDDKVRDD